MKHLGYILCLGLLGCGPNEDRGLPIAEAFDNTLYSSEIDELMNENTTFEDSVFIASEYINLWIRRQTILNKASVVLTEEEQDKSAETERYKNDLLVYETLNKLASEKMDTSVSYIEIEEYYDQHLQDFELAQNIIKVNFFKIAEDYDEIENYWRSFKSNSNNVSQTLADVCEKNKWSYFSDDNTWVYFDDILKEIPINTYNQEHYLNNNKFIRIKDDNFDYFVRIIDFKTTSNISPLEMEAGNIKNIILMQRQQQLLKEIETELIDDAYSNRKIKLN